MEQLRKESDLQPILERCIRILNDVGYKNINISNIRFNERLKSTYGRYISRDRVVEINKYHFLYGKLNDIENTIIHEIVHHLDAESYKDFQEYREKCYKRGRSNGGHTENWFKLAKDVTDKTGYVIERYGEHDIYIPEKPSKPKVKRYLHYFRCKKCKHVTWSYSKFEDPNKVIGRQKCEACQCYYNNDGEFEFYYTK
jgi:predicted SprT family Zn-dependent metalloprotease